MDTEPLAPQASRETPAARPPSAVFPLSLETVVAFARRHNRVCPLPSEWQRLFDLVPDKKQTSRGWRPEAPVSGRAGMTPAMSKRLMLREQIEWAAQRGALQPVFAFLQALDERQWLHVGESIEVDLTPD